MSHFVAKILSKNVVKMFTCQRSQYQSYNTNAQNNKQLTMSLFTSLPGLWAKLVLRSDYREIRNCILKSDSFQCLDIPQDNNVVYWF